MAARFLPQKRRTLVLSLSLALATFAAPAQAMSDPEAKAPEEAPADAAGESEALAVEGAGAGPGEQAEAVEEALAAVQDGEGLPPLEVDEDVEAIMAELLEPTVDEIVVDGTVLPGRVVRLTSETLEIETDYGEGTIAVPYSSIDRLETLRTFRVLYEPKQEARGRLVGIKGDVLLVGESRKSATRVPIPLIQRGVTDEEYDTNNLTILRTRFRYWNAALALGMNVETGAIEKRKVNIGFEVARVRAPWVFTVNTDYAFETQKRADETQPRTTKDEFYGTIRLQYDFWKRTFVYGTLAGEWDKPRGVVYRGHPNAGMGYRVWDSDRVLIQLSGGFGYVNEEFRGFGTNDYAAGVIGFQSEFKLPLDALFKWWMVYFPGLVDPGNNWLFRSEFSLSVPIWDPLALIFKVTEVNDNNPSPEVGNNKVETTLGFSLNF